jgi:hypothetical protein
MGCVSSNRSQLCAEETTLVTLEHELNYHTQSASQVDLVLRKYSSNGSLNVSQLHKAAIVLNIRTENFSTFNQIKPFYDNLQTQGFTPLKTLLLLGVLLAQGSLVDKARLLFEVYDQLMLEEVEVVTIVEDLFDVAVKRLPTLLGTKGNSEVTSAKIYLAKIEHVKTAGVSKLTKLIAGEAPKVSKKHFVTTVSSDSVKQILTPEGIRAYFFSVYSLSTPQVKQEFDRTWTRSHPLPPQPKPAGSTTVTSIGAQGESEVSRA